MFFKSFSSVSTRLFSRQHKALQADAYRGAATPPQEDLRELARRTVARDEVDFHTVVTVKSTGAVDARLMDISPYGFQSRARSRPLERTERVWVLLPLVGEREADVMWGLKGLFGCKFIEPIDAEAYAEMLALIRSATPSWPDPAE